MVEIIINLITAFIPKAYATKVSVCPNGSSGTCDEDFSSYIQGIYGFSIRLGGTLTVLMIIYAGYIYLTSQGDTSKINNAKDILTGTLLGFIMLLAAGLILNFLGMK